MQLKHDIPTASVVLKLQSSSITVIQFYFVSMHWELDLQKKNKKQLACVSTVHACRNTLKRSYMHVTIAKIGKRHGDENKTRDFGAISFHSIAMCMHTIFLVFAQSVQLFFVLLL